MRYEIIHTEKAINDFSKIDHSNSRRIFDKLDYFIETGHPLHYAMKLVNCSLGTYRFRIGDYRVIFDVDQNENIRILKILRIKHRKEVYR